MPACWIASLSKFLRFAAFFCLLLLAVASPCLFCQKIRNVLYVFISLFVCVVNVFDPNSSGKIKIIFRVLFSIFLRKRANFLLLEKSGNPFRAFNQINYELLQSYSHATNQNSIYICHLSLCNWIKNLCFFFFSFIYSLCVAFLLFWH